MTDVVDPQTRSRMMAGIRAVNTKPEIALRKALHRVGLRFRLHRKDLPGRPDIVLPRRNAVIFVHGCFWHRHEGCRLTSTPATRQDFWQEKFASNVDRDRRNIAALLADGWRVAVVWECALRKSGSPQSAAVEIATWLDGKSECLEVGSEGHQRE